MIRLSLPFFAVLQLLGICQGGDLWTAGASSVVVQSAAPIHNRQSAFETAETLPLGPVQGGGQGTVQGLVQEAHQAYPPAAGDSVVDSTLGSEVDLGMIESNQVWLPTEPVAVVEMEAVGVTEVDMGRPLADYWNPWRSLLRPIKRQSIFQRTWNRLWQDSGRARSITCDVGIGHERVMFAPAVVDTAVGTANVGLKLQWDQGLNTPDRAEYFWATAGLGPGADPKVDVLDTKFNMDLGNERLMVMTEWTMRSVDPTIAPNTTGVGDLVIGTKALMIDGKRLKVSSIMRTYIDIGDVDRGLGTGHISLEPGLLSRYCLSPKTYVFSEVKYWIPIAAAPGISGDVLSTGFAISTVARESDVYAMMPTLEVRTLTFLFGGESVGNQQRRIDGDTVVELYPGLRAVVGPEGDLGLWEFHINAGLTFGDRDWFDSRLMFGLRWIY